MTIILNAVKSLKPWTRRAAQYVYLRVKKKKKNVLFRVGRRPAEWITIRAVLLLYVQMHFCICKMHVLHRRARTQDGSARFRPEIDVYRFNVDSQSFLFFSFLLILSHLLLVLSLYAFFLSFFLFSPPLAAHITIRTPAAFVGDIRVRQTTA